MTFDVIRLQAKPFCNSRFRGVSSGITLNLRDRLKNLLPDGFWVTVIEPRFSVAGSAPSGLC